MPKTVVRFLIAAGLVGGLLHAQNKPQSPLEFTLKSEDFGLLHIYRDSQHPSKVALFVSGDGGWNQGVAAMARELAALGTLVVGININALRKSLAGDSARCSYLSGDFEDLSHYVQQKLGFPDYIFPVLIGYSSGATLVYATLVQSPTGTFRGAISVGFCPHLVVPKPLCRGSGLQSKPGAQRNRYVFAPDPGLASPWIAVQGNPDKLCGPDATAAFVKQTGRARMINLPEVGRALSVQRDWFPQLKQAFTDLLEAHEEGSTPPASPEVRDLPLVEVPAQGAASDTLAVLLSGDGGWAGIDRDLGHMLAQNGLAVVGLNSLQYFWKRRTPESAAADLDRILRHYMAVWNKGRAVLIGYSLGADALPFMANRLPADLMSRVALIALLGPSRTVDFEFHFTDWLGTLSRKTDFSVPPEIERLKGRRIVCFYGDEEEDSGCRLLTPGIAQVMVIKGGHHFNGDYHRIAETILKESK